MRFSIEKAHIQWSRRVHSWGIWLLVAVALVLRLLYLGANPPGINQDEAMNGYNAYSIAQTGCDLQGFCGSVLTHGFGHVDVRGALYSYLAAPPVRLFGLNEFTTRFPSLLLNLLLLVVLFRFVTFLTGWWEAGFLTSFWLVLNPWNFHFSRVGHESTIAPFLYFLGVFLLVSGLRGRPSRVVWSAIPFGLSFYAYQVAQVIVPLLVAGTAVLYYSRRYFSWRHMAGALVLLVVVVFPYVYEKYLAPISVEYRELQNVVWFTSTEPWRDQWRNWLTYLNPTFLFINDAADSFPSVGEFGVFQHHMLLLLLLATPGIVLLWRRHLDQRLTVVYMIFLLVVGVVAAGLSPSPHRPRAYSLFPAFYVLVAVGLCALGRHVRIGRVPTAHVIVLLVGILEGFHAAGYLPHYYRESPPSVEGYYEAGMQGAVTALRFHQTSQNKVYFTSRANQSFIYVLFYLAYPPAQFLSEEKAWHLGGWGSLQQFGRYHFVDDEAMRSLKGNNIYVSRLSDLDKVLLEVIYTPSGQAVFFIYRDRLSSA